MLRLLFLILVLCVGCQKTRPYDQKQALRINIRSDPHTLDPRKARDLTDTTVMHMLFEGLTRTSKEGANELALASSVDVSEDGTQYSFVLRKSFWSNGDPVTAFDFAESWKTMLDPQFPTDTAYQLYAIKNAKKAKLGEVGLEQVGIRTPDPYTLIVTLEQPVPYFLNLLAMPSFFPIPSKVANANHNWALQLDAYVCNGPFVPEIWTCSEQLRIVKNPRYWQAKEVQLSRIDLLMMPSDTEIRMFEAGHLDWAGSPLSTVPPDAISDLKQSGQLHVGPFLATYFFRVNTAERVQDKKNPLSSSRLRKALALSLNRAEMIEHVLQGGQAPAKSLVPPEMGLSERGYFQDSQSEKARSFLVDALLELDLTLQTLEPIKISYPNSGRNATIAQAAQKQWEKTLGIRVELDAIESKVFFQRIGQKEFQIAVGDWTADFDDPINFLEIFKYKAAKTNNTNWENAKYIDLLNQSALCRDSKERKGLLREAEQILMEQMPIIPVFHLVLNYLQCEKLEGVALSPLGGIDFRWARLDSSSL